MPNITPAVLSLCILIPCACAQDFSGSWRLKSSHAEDGALPERPAAAIEIEQHGNAVHCAAGAVRWSFTLDGAETRARVGQRSFNTVAKWEGSALLINTIVNGPGANYTQMDRWTISRDGRVLTVSREIAGRDVEATLIYERAGAQPEAPPQMEPPAGGTFSVRPLGTTVLPPSPKPAEYTIDAGTRVPLVLLSTVSTQHSQEGDRVYLRTAYPIASKGVVVIPPGSYVAGTLTFVKQPGRAKGRGELFIRFDSLTLPNGVTRDFRARVDQVDGSTHASVDGPEGAIKADSNKGENAKTVGETTAAGASVGGIAGAVSGHAGLGLGVGAAAGAATGLARVLLSHGPDTVLAKGSSVEMVLDRQLVFTADDLPHSFRRVR